MSRRADVLLLVKIELLIDLFVLSQLNEMSMGQLGILTATLVWLIPVFDIFNP